MTLGLFGRFIIGLCLFVITIMCVVYFFQDTDKIVDCHDNRGNVIMGVKCENNPMQLYQLLISTGLFALLIGYVIFAGMRYPDR